MRKCSKSYLILVAVLFLTSPLQITRVNGVPADIPHVITGIVSNYNPRFNNLLVEARINGETYSATFLKEGKFGHDPSFKVPADDPATEHVEGGVDGDSIDIYVDGMNITRLVFESGRIDHIVIEVPERLVAPTQAFSLDAYAGYSVLLDASKILGSSDFTGYLWDFGDGHTSEGETIAHSYASPGTYTTLLTTEKEGQETQQEVKVVVIPVPDPVNAWSGTTSIGENLLDLYDLDVKMSPLTLEPVTISLLEFDQVFLIDGLPDNYQEKMIAVDLSDLAPFSWPLYIELESTLDSSKACLYAWVDGSWMRTELSGPVGSGTRIGAFLSPRELEEGLFLVGYDDDASWVQVSDIKTRVESSNDGANVEISYSLTGMDGYTGKYPVNIMVDGTMMSQEIVQVSFITEQYVNQITLEPGDHTINLNGEQLYVKAFTGINSIMLIGLGTIPFLTLSGILLKLTLEKRNQKTIPEEF